MPKPNDKPTTTEPPRTEPPPTDLPRTEPEPLDTPGAPDLEDDDAPDERGPYERPARPRR